MAKIKQHDFVVIGGGSAGFNGARVAHELGMDVAIIDGASKLGGLCILQGCMPSKTLLHSTDILHLAQQGKRFGLNIPEASVNMKSLQKRKRRIIKEFADYRENATLSGRFKVYRQFARFIDPHTLELGDGSRIRGKYFLIATGSKISVPPIPGLADVPWCTSNEILDLDFVPESVIVLGGGIVACELGQFLNRIGSRVTLIQRSPQILRHQSLDAATVVQNAFIDEGIDLHTGTIIVKITPSKKGVKVHFNSGGKRKVREAQLLFNALGREPNIDRLSLENAGVKFDRRTKQVAINRWQQSSQPHIYAGGDVSGPDEVVHIAVAQGELAARHAAGVPGIKPIDQKLSLDVIFTDPQVASLGLSEYQLRSKNKPFLYACYPFDDHGKSILMDAKYGFVKIIAEPKTGRLLGAQIVGPSAGDLIHCLTGPLAMKATVHDLLKAPWYHPTLAEILTYPLEEIAEKLK